MKNESASPPRSIPRQRRSREIVESIVAAGQLILAEAGPDSLTTNRIAERAGVSIGSLYRYFPNKAAIVEAIYEAEALNEAAVAADREWVAGSTSLDETLARLVDWQIDRHRALLRLGGEYYRDHHREYSVGSRLGSRQVEGRIRGLLLRHADRVHVRDIDQAAYLVGRGVPAILRSTIDERPEKLDDPRFREEIVDMLVAYLTMHRLARPQASESKAIKASTEPEKDQ
jgi:AcrR family transcriptional regulator